MIQSFILQEVWKRQYSISQKLCMKSWSKLRFVACVAPDVVFLRSGLLTHLLQILSLCAGVHSFVRDTPQQRVGSTEKYASLLASLFIHLSTCLFTRVSIHLGNGFVLPILMVDKVTKPSILNTFQLIPWWNGTYCFTEKIAERKSFSRVRKGRIFNTAYQ